MRGHLSYGLKLDWGAAIGECRRDAWGPVKPGLPLGYSSIVPYEFQKDPMYPIYSKGSKRNILEHSSRADLTFIFLSLNPDAPYALRKPEKGPRLKALNLNPEL